MSITRNYQLIFSLLVTAIFLFSLTLLSPKSVGRYESNISYDDEQQRKMVLGSRPPGCVNKCMNCRPCEATLVIPPHDKVVMRRSRRDFYQRTSSHREDGSYYLLAWKCRIWFRAAFPATVRRRCTISPPQAPPVHQPSVSFLLTPITVDCHPI